MGFTWTDDPLVTGTTGIKALHWNQPKTNLDTLYAALGLDYAGCTGAAWTLLPVSATSKIQASELTQLRQRTDHAYDNWCGTHMAAQNSHYHNNDNINEDNPYHGTHLNGYDNTHHGTYHPDYHGTHDTDYHVTYQSLEYVNEETGYHGNHYSTDKGTDNPDYHGTYHITHNVTYHPGYCSLENSSYNPDFHAGHEVTYHNINNVTYQTNKYIIML